MLHLFNVPPSYSLSSSLSRLPAPHTHVSRNLCHAGICELVFAQRDVNSNSNGRSCRQWNGKNIVQLAAGKDWLRSKKIILLDLVSRDLWTTRSLFFYFYLQLCLVTSRTLWDAKWWCRERQRVLDQIASSESKDTDSYSTWYSRLPWHPAGSYGALSSVLSPCRMKEIARPVSLSAPVKIATIFFFSFCSFEN